MKPKSKNRILQGAHQALAFAGGKANLREYRIHVPAGVDVAKLRRKLQLSQAEFAHRFGFNAASLKDWEQGRTNPPSPVRAYLKVIEKEPKAVKRALARAT